MLNLKGQRNLRCSILVIFRYLSWKENCSFFFCTILCWFAGYRLSLSLFHFLCVLIYKKPTNIYWCTVLKRRFEELVLYLGSVICWDLVLGTFQAKITFLHLSSTLIWTIDLYMYNMQWALKSYWMLFHYTEMLLSFSLPSNRVNKIIEKPASITQYNSAVPQTRASKMTIQLNHHLSRTVSTKTECHNLHKGWIYCRTIVSDYISFS